MSSYGELKVVPALTGVSCSRDDIDTVVRCLPHLRQVVRKGDRKIRDGASVSAGELYLLSVNDTGMRKWRDGEKWNHPVKVPNEECYKSTHKELGDRLIKRTWRVPVRGPEDTEILIISYTSADGTFIPAAQHPTVRGLLSQLEVARQPTTVRDAGNSRQEGTPSVTDEHWDDGLRWTIPKRRRLTIAELAE